MPPAPALSRAGRSTRHLETNKENTLKHASKTSGSRALLVLCALGLLCANTGLAAAKDQAGQQQTAKPKKPGMVLNIISGAQGSDIAVKRDPKNTGKTKKK